MENKLERPSRIKRILKNEIFGIFIILILMCIALTILRPTSFPTAANFASIGRSISYTGVMAVGMTFVIITGGIDLTVGSVFGLAWLSEFAFSQTCLLRLVSFSVCSRACS